MGRGRDDQVHPEPPVPPPRPHLVSHLAEQFPALIDQLPGIVRRCANTPEWPTEALVGAVSAITGHDPSEFLEGRVSWGRMIHPEDRARVWRTVQNTAQTGEPFRVRYRIVRSDGQERVLSEQGCTLKHSDGSILAVEGFVWDVTEQHELERRLDHAQRVEAIGLFTCGIAHDFNNILTVILASTELAAMALPQAPPDARESLARVKQAANRGTAMIRKLLELTRQPAYEPERVDLVEVARELIPMIERLLPESVNLTTGFSEQPVYILGDRTALDQILFNLVSNARDAMKQGGTLTVEVAEALVERQHATHLPWTPPGRYGRLIVRDTGTGIPSDILPRIFDAFVTTKPKSDGSGLGLTMVYGLVKQHQGSVYARSEGATGAEFTVYFPLAMNTAGTPTIQRPLAHAEVPRGHETVLVVEDAADLRETARRALESFGYRVLTAADGEQAMRILEADPSIDLVFADLIVPRLWGRDLYEQVRDRAPDARFLFVSGYRHGELIRDFHVPKQVPYLAKPWTIEELGQQVRQLLDDVA